MRVSATWTGAFTLSALLHSALAALVFMVFAPRSVEQMPAASAEMSLTTLTVPRSDVAETAPMSDAADQQELASEGVGARPIPKSELAPGPLPTLDTTPQPIDTPRTPLTRPNAPVLAAAVADSPPSSEKRPEALRLPAGTILATPVGLKAPGDGIASRLVFPRPVRLAPQSAAPALVKPTDFDLFGTRPAVIPTTGQSSRPVAFAALMVPANRSNNRPTAPVMPDQTPLTADVTTGTKVRPGAPETSHATEVQVHGEETTPVLAWTGTLSVEVEQQTLDAAAALRLPSAGADAEGLRDALAASLSQVECARAQTIYNPDTGTIDLRGHVKDDEDRTRLVASISQELGGALPLIDRLQRLDAPQCGVLVRLSDMPLPQSVEQFINPLIIGANFHTRSYSFDEGQSMVFDLAGADYDGWLYLDYYDAEGQVLHLAPNKFIDPFILEAEASLVFGDRSDRDPAKGKFELRVSQPFGQDIAVAMVTSERLFDGPRPIVEPAASYLAVLANRLGDLRRLKPDFRGEWVYLFVETQAVR